MKNKIALLMIAVVLIGSMTGCGKTDTGDTGDGQTVTVYVNNGAGTGAGADTGSQTEGQQAVRDYFKEKIGIDVIPIIPPKGNEDAKLNMLLASDEKLDLFWGNWEKFSDKNAILPLNDLIEQYGQNIKSNWPAESWTAMTDAEGTIWAMPRNTPTISYPAYVRTDWLEELGLAMPKTIDELEAVLAAIKEADPAGNNSTIPLLTSLSGLRVGLSAAFTGVANDKYMDADGTIKPIILHPNYKAFLERMHDWYQKGYIFKEAFSIKTAQARDYVKQNKVGVHIDWYSNITLSINDLRSNFPQANYEITPLESELGKALTVGNVSTQGAMVSAKSQSAEAAVQLMDFLNSDTYSYIVANYGIEGTDWEFTDKENMVVKTSENPRYFGELNVALGVPLDNKLSFDPVQNINAMHMDYLKNVILDYDRGVKPPDYGRPFNSTVISEKVPSMSDITRMIDEETVKFIMGARSLSEFDAFIEELKSIGIDDLTQAYTELYNQNR